MTEPHRILVVDDNDLLRENLAESLELEGFQVDVASDGRRALDRLAEGPLPEVVIVDMMMPGMSGTELLARIRGEPRLAGLRLVLATGAEPPPGSIQADAVLEKPFGVAALLRAVRPLLRPA